MAYWCLALQLHFEKHHLNYVNVCGENCAGNFVNSTYRYSSLGRYLPRSSLLPAINWACDPLWYHKLSFIRLWTCAQRGKFFQWNLVWTSGLRFWAVYVSCSVLYQTWLLTLQSIGYVFFQLFLNGKQSLFKTWITLHVSLISQFFTLGFQESSTFILMVPDPTPGMLTINCDICPLCFFFY